MTGVPPTSGRADVRARARHWLRGANWWLLSPALLAGACLVAADEAWSFGTKKPVVAAISADLVLLVLVAGAVDSVLRSRENARVAEVARVLYRVMAQLALDGDRWLRALVTGTDLAERGVPQWTEAHTVEVRRLHRTMWGAGYEPATTAVPERLDVLLGSHAFVRLMYRDVSVYKRRLHDVVGQWAPVLLASGSSAADLGKIRELADRLGDLHQAIYHGAATTLSAASWQAPEEWRRSTHAAFLDYLDAAENVRAFYHVLAEENRRIGAEELDRQGAVTQQVPLYQRAATRRSLR